MWSLLRKVLKWIYTPPTYGPTPANIQYHRSEQGEDLSERNVAKEDEW